MSVVVTDCKDPTSTLITIRGDLDAYAGVAVRRQLQPQVLDSHLNLIVDLSGVGFLNLDGVAVVAVAAQRLRVRGGRTIVVCADPASLRLFRQIGLFRVLTVCSTLDEATSNAT